MSNKQEVTPTQEIIDASRQYEDLALGSSKIPENIRRALQAAPKNILECLQVTTPTVSWVASGTEPGSRIPGMCYRFKPGLKVEPPKPEFIDCEVYEDSRRWYVCISGATELLSDIHGRTDFVGITYKNRIFSLAQYNPMAGTPVSVRLRNG